VSVLFHDVRTSEIKLQFKQCCRWSDIRTGRGETLNGSPLAPFLSRSNTEWTKGMWDMWQTDKYHRNEAFPSWKYSQIMLILLVFVWRRSIYFWRRYICAKNVSFPVTLTFIYIYYVIVLKVHTHTHKKKKCTKRKENKKKQLTTNMCIDHQLIP